MACSCGGCGNNKVLKAVKEGESPIYIKPYCEKKVWGVDGIGEYWYGAEKGEKSSIAEIDQDVLPLDELLGEAAKELIGEKVINNFGKMLPLTKILTPNNRLSVQFHDSKNELWVVTGIDRDVVGDEASIILGFSAAAVDKHGKNVSASYHDALEKYGDLLNALIDKMEEKGFKALLDDKKDVVKAANEVNGEDQEIASLLDDLLKSSEALDWFYHKKIVNIGDVIPVPAGTLHALGRGIQVLEPQIPGPTQSMEDGATYPVRYAFPKHKRETATKILDLDRVEEIIPSMAEDVQPLVIEETAQVRIERLPGGFEDKGMEVRRINMSADSELIITGSTSDHLFAIVNDTGKAVLVHNDREFNINRADPGKSLILVPASMSDFKILAKGETQIIDTFTPV